ncbi:hypothetical protein D3Z50_11005 [Clostridiaceae bacterium]|nr:hypothetical protein [Clostridiaceae bacterium]
MDLWKRFYEEEDGMGTVEIVMIIAALVSVALLFRKQVMSYGKGIMEKVFEDTEGKINVSDS